MRHLFVLLWSLSLLLILTSAAKRSKDRIGCNQTCGNLTVPFPFGIDEARCALGDNFLLKCNRSNNILLTDQDYPKLIFRENVSVLNISVEEGSMSVGIPRSCDCYNKTGGLTESWNGVNISLGNGTFKLSNERNKLIVYGCDTIALMYDTGGNYGSGCISLCINSTKNLENKCSGGFGCCQTSVPKSLTTLHFELGSVATREHCAYAFIADERSLDMSNLHLKDCPDQREMQSDVLIEWVVEEKTCSHAQQDHITYACGDNTDCIYSENGQGYRCLCKEGFGGNPYIQDGCQDIDECEQPEIYPCGGRCENIIGNYTCKCPFGMQGDGKLECQGFRMTTVMTVVLIAIFCPMIGFIMLCFYQWRTKQRHFIKNGGMLLNHQRVRIFNEAELKRATNNYDKSNLLGEGGTCYVYKGILDNGLQIAVKKPKEAVNKMTQEFQHEIQICSQVNHKNVVKLLGLCLEAKFPLMVYDFIPNGPLSDHIHDNKKSAVMKDWKIRLRIAAETALALDYLHSLADPPIIHRDVKSSNILLDENYVAKVSDFGASVFISPNQTALLGTNVHGTLGYLDPEYLMTGILTEKSDVYSFGVVLVELLTGQKPGDKGENIIQNFLNAMETNHLSGVLGVEADDDGCETEEVEVVADLANRCLSRTGAKRPTMREVAQELAKLKNLWPKQQNNSIEEEHLLADYSTEGHTNFLATFEVEDYSSSE